MKHFFFIACCFVISLCGAQSPLISRDLQSEWLIFKNNKYVSYQDEEDYKTIYIQIKAREGSGDYIQIQSKQQVFVFLNQQYLTKSKATVAISVDSLRKRYNVQNFSLAIHAKNITKESISTKLIRYPVIQPPAPDVLRPANAVLDFTLIASIIVLVLLIVIIKLNPKLASDYFSVTKIFSLRESEDSQVYTRITSSTNFLFYGFSSVTIGFFLVILFSFLPQHKEELTFQQIIRQWLWISTLIALTLIAKMIIVFLFASLFKLREVVGFQFFNWARLLFLLVGFALLLMVASVLIRVDSPEWFNFFYLIVGWVMAVWLVLVFFKIAAKARIGVFHLFSYLCATEIIPSLILLKILYY
jgi:hypothetical protein